MVAAAVVPMDGNEEEAGEKAEAPPHPVVGEEYCVEEEQELTVRKTSLFFPGDGFAAYDHHTGELVFRVDNYDRGPTDQLVLMDPAGASILTVRRKWPSLHQRWEGFIGERREGQRALFTVRRSSIFGGGRAAVAVEVHGGAVAEYRVEGSFGQRCCRVVYEGKEEGVVVAEIKRKVDAVAHVVLGRDVFCLCLRPRFDAAFAMGIVLVLDRINGDDDVDGGAVELDEGGGGGGEGEEADGGGHNS